MPKYLIIPSNSNEYWDIDFVVLTATQEQCEALIMRDRIFKSIFDLLKTTHHSADRITCFYTIFPVDAWQIMEISKLPKNVSVWMDESPEHYHFLEVPDEWNPEDHGCQLQKTDAHSLSFQVNGDGIWIKLHNKHGEGSLEVEIPKVIYSK